MQKRRYGKVHVRAQRRFQEFKDSYAKWAGYESFEELVAKLNPMKHCEKIMMPQQR